MSVDLYDDVTFIVEIGFSTSGGAGLVPLGSTMSSIVWTDVTDYVQGVSINRGRSNELDEFSTGSATVVLENNDRRFDPEYADGPYYGSLTPMRPVRIGASYDGGFYQELFMGWVDGWPQSYQGQFGSTVTLNVSDGFKVLNQLTLPAFWPYHIEQHTPDVWFRFDDGDGSATAFEEILQLPVGQWKNASGAATSSSATGLLADDGSAAASFDGDTWLEVPASRFPFAFGDSANKTLEFWIQTTTTDDGSYGIFFKPYSEFIIAAGMFVTSGVGIIKAIWGSVAGVSIATEFTSSVRVNDGRPHHVCLRFQYGVVQAVVVDGVQTSSGTSFNTNVVADINTATVGKAYTASLTATYVNTANNFVGDIDELIFYTDLTLSLDEVVGHRNIGRGTYLAGQSTEGRIGTILTMADWMSDGTDLGTGRGTVRGILTNGVTALDAIKEAEAAEQGRVFMDVAGNVKFVGREQIGESSTYVTSQATFGDGAGELHYLDIGTNYDDQRIYNRITVQRDGGPSVTVNDTASQSRYFIKTNDLTGLITDTDDQSFDIANARLAAYADPQLRIESLTFDPRSAPADLFPISLAFEIGTRITVNRRPQGVGDPISRDVFIESVAHDITPDTWTTTYQLSPVYFDPWIVEDATNGYIDSTFAVGY